MSQSPRENSPADAETSIRFAKRVLLVGWDGVEFSQLSPHLQGGRLPHLSSLLDRGASVELSLPRPVLMQAAWTSLATGRRPHEHGILHADSPSSDGSNLRPVSGRARRCPAIWNLLNRAGLRTHVIGWPATHPAESLSGVCVSDHFAMPVARRPPTPLGGRAVSPSAAELVLRSLRVAPSQIEEITLSQLLPLEAAYLAEYQPLAAICRGILAETATLFRVLRWCIKKQPWDFAACVFPGIRSCHELASWMRGISPAAAEFSDRLLTGCYEHHDLLLGQLLPLVGEDSHLIAVSLAQRCTATMEANDDGDAPPRIGTPIRKLGLAVICGLGVRRLRVQSSRSGLDLVPTMGAMLAIPVGSDLFGRCWQDLFDVDLRPRLALQPSRSEPWEWNFGDEPVEELDEAIVSGENDPASGRGRDPSVQHLVELGYVDPLDVAAKDAEDKCRSITEVNRAKSLMDAGLLAEAVACLEQLEQEHPEWLDAHAVLAEAYFRSNRWQSARDQIDWLMCRGCESPQLYLLSAAVDLACRQFESALEELRCAGRAGVALPGSQVIEGDVHLRMRDFVAAEAAFRSSIDRDGPTLHALEGLAAVNLHAGRYEEAAMNALDALSQEMRFGRAHYRLAAALLQLDKPHEALRALESWAAAEPLAAAPFRWLAARL